MKFATWNINGVVQRLELLTNWLDATAPDVVCLQELKCAPAQFPADALEAAGYGAVWHAESRWNGVAILTKGEVPRLIRTSLPGDADDVQARYIEAAVAGRIIASVYVPNGNPTPGPKFDYKLAWMDRLLAHAQSLLDSRAPVILAGDFNVAPTPLDVYASFSDDSSALVKPEARARFDDLMSRGLIDAFRRLHPGAAGFTFWNFMRRRWESDKGLRLDFVLLDQLTALGLDGAKVDREMRGAVGASDHVPLVVRTT